MKGIPFYTTPQEAASAAQGETDAALGYVISEAARYLQMKVDIRKRLEATDDTEEIGELEWELKLLRNEEQSLLKIGSMLQSRLKVP